MKKLRLSALAATVALLLFAAPAVFGAPLRQVVRDYLMIGAQTTLSLNVKLVDGSSVVVPVDLQMTTHLLNGDASMDVHATVGEGTSATTATAIDIPAVIETVPDTSEDPDPTVREGIANRNANLRLGPGTDYAITGSVRVGEELQIVGESSDGSWLQLANGAWIAAFLVNEGAAPGSSPTGNTMDSASTTGPTTTATATTVVVPPTPTDTPVPLPTFTPTATTRPCDPSYPDEDMCIPPGAADLDCGDIPHRRFTVLPPDRHRFDGDNDGVGCES